MTKCLVRLGHYVHGEQSVIRIAKSQLAEPARLIATLAHELAHELLLGGGLLSASATDHEWVTDLLPVYFRFGDLRGEFDAARSLSGYRYVEFLENRTAWLPPRTNVRLRFRAVHVHAR